MDVSDDADRLQTLLYSSYSADVVRQLERPLLDDGVPLMRMAASAVARVTLSLLDDEDLDVEDARVTVLAGAGDNGGDGLYAGAELAREGAQVTAVAVGRSLHEDAFREFVRAGGRVLVLDPAADIPGCTSGFSAGEAGERLQARCVVSLARWLRLWVWMACCRTSLRCRTMTLPLICRWWWPSMRRRVWVLMMVRCRGRIFLRM